MALDKDRLYTRLQEAMGTQLGYRGDLFVADHKPINKNAVKVLVGYNNTLGQPNMSDISKFVVSSFTGRVMPCLETARIYPDNGAVSLIVSKVRPTRSFDDSKRMIRIAATLYLDETIGDTWEVQKNGDRMFLARIDDDNVSDIVAQRMQSMQIKATVTTFDNLSGAKSLASVQNGDTVRFFHDNEEKEGQVISIGPAKATIKSKGSNVVVDPVAIFEIMKVGISTRKDTSDTLRKYYKEAYPENYGDMYINLYNKDSKSSS